MNDILLQKLKDLPDKPGVYIMLSENEQILYIGKAKILKNRVRQYFHEGGGRDAKLIALVSKIVDFNYIITRNELEALVLENNLIKQHKPPYNILLKDDKSYPFIRIDLKEDFPRIEVVRRLKADGAKYFGPYMLGITTKDIFELIDAAFRVRTCKNNLKKMPKKHRPCIYYHIGQCLAPCSGQCSKEEYCAEVEKIVQFLSGHDKEAEVALTKKMQRASESEDFEHALLYREQLNVLDKLVRKQVTALPRDLNMDVFAVAASGLNTVVAMLFIRGGKLIGGDKKQITNLSLNKEAALSSYLMQHYDTEAIITGEIVLCEPIPDIDILSEILSERLCGKVNIVVPHQGVRRQLADIAQNNATDFLEKSLSTMERLDNMTMGGVIQLQEYLNLYKLPIRIECYDISNISGSDSVSSMVVFKNGEPAKKLYRRFKIKTVTGANDFASMKETLVRRMNRADEGLDESFSEFPDLIVIDGGRGQLKYASEALVETGHADIEIISLAERNEDIFLPSADIPKILSKDSYALRLLQRLRDEAHRFALSYHRKLRDKRMLKK